VQLDPTDTFQLLCKSGDNCCGRGKRSRRGSASSSGSADRRIRALMQVDRQSVVWQMSYWHPAGGQGLVRMAYVKAFIERRAQSKRKDMPARLSLASTKVC
jgi:hypothetical protein